MSPPVTKLLSLVDEGIVTPKNAQEAIRQAGGEALVTLEVVRALAAGGGGPGGNLVGGGTIVTPDVIHVTTSGNDTTGDGSLAKPFATLARARTEANGAACTLQVGRGSFIVTCSGWPSNQVIKGEGWTATSVSIISSAAVNLTAHDCYVAVEATGATGTAGVIYGDGDNGGVGGAGENAPGITIVGTAKVNFVKAMGGNGGVGGPGANEFGLGGIGGAGGEAVGPIILKCLCLDGPVIFEGGTGGAGGLNVDLNTAASGANGGATGTLITDGTYMVESSQTNVTSWKAGRCSYSTGTPTTDFGGNAIIP